MDAIEPEGRTSAAGEFPELRASWYRQYWYENDHSPDLAFLVARFICDCGYKLVDLAKRSPAVVEGEETGVARRRWTPIRLSMIRDLGGAAVIIASFMAGSSIVSNFDLPIPSGVLGMIILLSLLGLSVVSVDVVRRASAGVLYLLPVLFVPLYVEPFSNWTFWASYGSSLLPVVAISAAALLLLAHFLASRASRG